MRPSIDSLLYQLDEAMHTVADQPFTIDHMSLTRAWRAILEDFVGRPYALRGTHRDNSSALPKIIGRFVDPDDWRTLSVTAIAAENASVYEYVAALEQEAEKYRALMNLLRKRASQGSKDGEPRRYGKEITEFGLAYFDIGGRLGPALTFEEALESEARAVIDPSSEAAP